VAALKAVGTGDRHLPHAGSGRRQAAALGAHPRRPQPRAGAALDPLLALAQGSVQGAAAALLPGGGGGAAAHPVSADLRAWPSCARSRRSAPRSAASWRGEGAPQRLRAPGGDDRDAQRGGHRRPAGQRVRVPHHRHQRPHPVRRWRPTARTSTWATCTTRCHPPSCASCARWCWGPARRQAPGHVRRHGRRPAVDLGAAGPGLRDFSMAPDSCHWSSQSCAPVG
jgi:hypothetical protein